MYSPPAGATRIRYVSWQVVSPFWALYSKALPCLVEWAGFEPTSLLLQTTNGWLAHRCPLPIRGPFHIWWLCRESNPHGLMPDGF